MKRAVMWIVVAAFTASCSTDGARVRPWHGDGGVWVDQPIQDQLWYRDFDAKLKLGADELSALQGIGVDVGLQTRVRNLAAMYSESARNLRDTMSFAYYASVTDLSVATSEAERQAIRDSRERIVRGAQKDAGRAAQVAELAGSFKTKPTEANFEKLQNAVLALQTEEPFAQAVELRALGGHAGPPGGRVVLHTPAGPRSAPIGDGATSLFSGLPAVYDGAEARITLEAAGFRLAEPDQTHRLDRARTMVVAIVPDEIDLVVTGRVICADTGEPIEGAMVAAEGHEARTDRNGRFELVAGRGVEARRCELAVRRAGYAPRSYAVTARRRDASVPADLTVALTKPEAGP